MVLRFWISSSNSSNVCRAVDAPLMREIFWEGDANSQQSSRIKRIVFCSFSFKGITSNPHPSFQSNSQSLAWKV